MFFLKQTEIHGKREREQRQIQKGRDMDIKSKRETIAEIQEGVSLALTFPPQELRLMVSF